MATLILINGTDNADMTAETTLRGAPTLRILDRYTKDDPDNAGVLAAMIEAKSTAASAWDDEC